MHSVVRRKTFVAAVAVVALALVGAQTAAAAPLCAGVSVTAPSPVGTNGTGTICQPTLLGNSFYNNACGGVPPAGISYCYNVRVPLP